MRLPADADERGGLPVRAVSENGSAPAKLLVTPEEAAEALAISRTRVYELLRRGELKSVKIGKVRRIPVAALQAYVEQLQEAS